MRHQKLRGDVVDIDEDVELALVRFEEGGEDAGETEVAGSRGFLDGKEDGE